MSKEVVQEEMAQGPGSDFIERINQFLAISQWKQTRLARAAGISTATLSQFIQGNYKGDNETMRLKLLSVLDRELEKAGVKMFNPDFIETSASKRFNDVANICRLECDMGVVYADAGIGKTEAARQFASRNLDVILIEADPGYTATVLIRELYNLLGSSGKSDLHDMMVDCIDRLKGSGRLIIIDEAEQLPTRALEAIRRIHDKAGVGILLVGMPKLLSNLRGFRCDYAQIYNRVGIAAKLCALTQDDTKLVIEKIIGKTDGLWRVFHKESAGITRRLLKLIKRSISIADTNDVAIDTEVVETASKYLKVEVMS
jgi:DNA transposition AAA+ family ATPase